MSWVSRVRIDRRRVLDDLHRLRRFGAVEYVAGARGGDGVPKGVVRPALTVADVEAREWLMERCARAGLAPSMDRLGTTLARGACADAGQPRLLAGSHSDSQPTGGWLDGALGVVYALEAARALADAGGPAALDVVNFQDEEGRFGSLTGSSAFVGDAVDERARSSCPERAAPRETLAQAVAARGLADRPLLTLDGLDDRGGAGGGGAAYGGFFEAHIEQATRLERAGAAVAVVSGIVGLRQLEVTFEGVQAHAGATAMADRRDAMLAACRFGAAVDARFEAAAAAARGEGDAPSSLVWTIGQLELEPNAPSIVPGRARLALQFRAADEAALDELEALARALADELAPPCAVACARARPPVSPIAMDAGMRAHVEAAAREHAPGAWRTLPSGAVHDAGNLARRMPAAMLFVPSIGGVSHDFTEDTREDDIAAGAQVYAAAAARMIAAWREA